MEGNHSLNIVLIPATCRADIHSRPDGPVCPQAPDWRGWQEDMIDKVYVFKNGEAIDFFAAHDKLEAEKQMGRKSSGHLILSKLFRPEEKNGLQLAAALDLAAEEYDDILDDTTKAVIRISASKIRGKFFE